MVTKKKPVAITVSSILTSKQRFVRNVRWQFVAIGSQVLIGGAYLILLARYLGPAEFGVFSTVMAVISVVGLLFEMRLQEIVARDFCHLEDEKSKLHPHPLYLVDLFVLEIVSRLLPLMVLLMLSELLVRVIRLEPADSDLITLAAVGFMVSKSGSSVSTGLLRVLGRTDLIAYCTSVDSGLRLVISSIFVIIWHLNVDLALWIGMSVGVICNGTQIWLAGREFSLRIAPVSPMGWNVVSAWERLRVARRLIISNLGLSVSDLMAKDLDVLVISSLLSADKVGIYKMTKNFVQLIWRAIDPFYIAIMTEIQRLWQLGEVGDLIYLLRKTSFRLLLLSIALVALGTTMVSLVGDKILGDEFRGVADLMLIMSIWIVFCAPLIWGIPLAVAINRPELSVGGSVIGLIIGLIGFTILTPSLGLIGAAIALNATLISGFISTSGFSLWATREKLFYLRDNNI